MTDNAINRKAITTAMNENETLLNKHLLQELEEMRGNARAR
jgi:hypothetical protein